MIKDYFLFAVQILFDLISLIILAKVLLSWFPGVSRDSIIIKFIDDIASPFLSFARKFIPPLGGVLDLSPIIVLLALDIFKVIIMTLISSV